HRSAGVHRARYRRVHHQECGDPAGGLQHRYPGSRPSHNLVGKDRLVRRGDWTASTRRIGKEPRGRVVGTVGFGNIAREAVRLLKALDVGRFLTYDPFASAAEAAEMGVEMVPLDELLAASDYVLINCPLTESTRKLIGERELNRMKPDAVLINTARGPIVDEAALARALQAGRI